MVDIPLLISPFVRSRLSTLPIFEISAFLRQMQEQAIAFLRPRSAWILRCCLTCSGSERLSGVFVTTTPWPTFESRNSRQGVTVEYPQERSERFCGTAPNEEQLK